MIHIILAAMAIHIAASNLYPTSADEAMTIARKITEEGSATFDTKNAQAMANSYLDDAELQVVMKDSEKGGLKILASKGRSEIEKFYADLFKDAKQLDSQNIVDHARLIQPDVLTISGTFEVKSDSSTNKFPFDQVRVKQGDRWRIMSMRVFALSLGQ